MLTPVYNPCLAPQSVYSGLLHRALTSLVSDPAKQPLCLAPQSVLLGVRMTPVCDLAQTPSP